MLFFGKGKKIERFIDSSPGIMLDLNENGGVLLFIIDEEHIGQYRLGGHYDFWCTSFNETLFFAVKLRDNQWASAPYSPFLSTGYKPTHYPKGQGMSLSIALVSTTDGVIKDFDYLVLGSSFSNAISKLNEEILSKGFNPVKHQMTVRAVYQKFSTDEELVEQPGATYSID